MLLHSAEFVLKLWTAEPMFATDSNTIIRRIAGNLAAKAVTNRQAEILLSSLDWCQLWKGLLVCGGTHPCPNSMPCCQETNCVCVTAESFGGNAPPGTSNQRLRSSESAGLEHQQAHAGTRILEMEHLSTTTLFRLLVAWLMDSNGN